MRITTLLATVTTAASALACDAVPLVAPTQSTVRLVVADASLPNGSSTMITATVTEAAGTPVHDGTVVAFSTTLGAVHPPEAPTARGRASATFTAGGESGAAELLAYSGDAVSEPVQVTIGAAAAATVHLIALPASLPPAGGSTELVATVLDAAQNPLPNVRLAFAATAGVLRDRVATTDRSGEARTVLSTTTASEVTASVGDVSGSVSVAVDPVTVVSIDATPPRPAAGQAVSFSVTLSNAARVIHSAAISFGDGRVLQLGATARATVTHTYAAPGAYTVTVTATDVAGYTTASSIAVEVTPAPGIPVAVTASPDDPVAGQTVTFAVDVSPPADAPAVREVAIDFGDRTGTSLGALSGRGSVAHIYDEEGSYIVAATVLDAAGRRHTASIGLQVRPAPSIAVTLAASPAEPVEDQPVTFTVDVSPPAGAPAVREVTVDFGDRSRKKSLGALTGRGSVAHIYRNDGSYIVTATVLDAAGRRHASSIGIVVADD